MNLRTEQWEKRDQSWGVGICMYFLWGKLTLLKCEYLANGWMDFYEPWRFGKLTFYAIIL